VSSLFFGIGVVIDYFSRLRGQIRRVPQELGAVIATDFNIDAIANIIVRTGFRYVEANLLSGIVWLLESAVSRFFRLPSACS
jgi:hypothetical protein